VIEPAMIELSIEILDELAIEEIIYAEYALPGAMGNAGGVMIYNIKDGNFNCYEANIYKNENIYYKAVDILKRNQISCRYNNTINENRMFKFYGGGMGNNVLINKNFSLKIADGYFIYSKNDKEYNIYSSVQGVFTCILSAMLRQKYRKYAHRFRDWCKNSADDAKKQNELLQEKLDKEIIAGKIYTEKEINVILKACCMSQDYVSFRRELIDKGYLYRTNDCKAYWRN
jgi:hypothetical protein